MKYLKKEKRKQPNKNHVVIIKKGRKNNSKNGLLNWIKTICLDIKCLCTKHVKFFSANSTVQKNCNSNILVHHVTLREACKLDVIIFLLHYNTKLRGVEKQKQGFNFVKQNRVFVQTWPPFFAFSNVSNLKGKYLA